MSHATNGIPWPPDASLFPTADDVRAAAGRLAGVTVRTPLVRSDALSDCAGALTYLKCEQAQHTGSFKLRGAFNALASLPEAARAHGIVASSAGNHGLGVAYAARALKLHARVFIPANAPTVKRDGIVALGADVDVTQPDYDATYLVRDLRRQPNTFTPELSRRARAVEFWAALKALGRSGVQELLDRSCAHATRFAAGLTEAGYEVLNDVVLNQVVFACEDEARTGAALANIQVSGVCWLGPTHWRGRLAMRISVSSWATSAADVELSLAAMARARASVA